MSKMQNLRNAWGDIAFVIFVAFLLCLALHGNYVQTRDEKTCNSAGLIPVIDNKGYVHCYKTDHQPINPRSLR